MDCIFCKIITKEMPVEFVYENDSVMAFRDVHPKAPVHILIVPRAHIVSINDLKEEHAPVITALMLSASTVAEKMGVKDGGYKLAFNVGRGGGQIVDHIHMHLLAWPADRNEEKPISEIFHSRDTGHSASEARSDDAGVVSATSRRSDAVFGAEWPYPKGLRRFSRIASLLLVTVAANYRFLVAPRAAGKSLATRLRNISEMGFKKEVFHL